MGRTLQRDLNRIAEVADTSSSEGLRYVLTGETPTYEISFVTCVLFVLYHVGLWYFLFTDPVDMIGSLCISLFKEI